ncbi:MAG TPA: plastocyanin/azurin family copper-binding protein, partial [Solirubrobacteraceae bacterium]|nr:plastocyanin/azurin family copper-binding protein [Solirubrobacteraceae bacterium]
MRKGVCAAIALTMWLAGTGVANAANEDVYARETANGLCFSADPDGACLAGEEGNVSISPGETVTWHFDGSTMPHNAADSEHGQTPEWAVPDHFVFVTSGDYPHQFATEGTYEFFCDAHPGAMDGTITVQDEPVDPDPTPSPSPSPSPSPTPIPQPGGT